MKQLILAKPHLLILAGIPGAGKTYFADHFAKMYNLPLISNDNTAKILFEKPNQSDDEQSIVRRINQSELQQLIKTGSHIVYDGYSETRVSRQELAKLAERSGYEPLIIWVQTDIMSAKKRALSSSSLLDEKQFKKSIAKFTQPNEREKHTVISGKHLAANQIRSVINKLRSV